MEGEIQMKNSFGLQIKWPSLLTDSDKLAQFVPHALQVLDAMLQLHD
jgi:hypothetical protein